MLPAKNRFPHRLGPDFFKNAQVVHTSLLRIYVQPLENETQPAQVMIVVPKKVVLKATQRNFYKRQIQEAIRPHLENLKGLQVVFYLKKKPQPRLAKLETK